MTSRRRALGIMGVGVSAGYPVWTRAEPGVRDDELLIGRTTPASPPFTPTTMQRRVGANACIAAINVAGGIHGRKLRIVDLDDAYVPERAAANARQLIERDGVFALLGGDGGLILFRQGCVQASGATHRSGGRAKGYTVETACRPSPCVDVLACRRRSR